MKPLLATLSVIAILGLTAPAFAGPNAGDSRFGKQVTQQMRQTHEQRAQAAPYALTGERAQVQDYRWESKLQWVGGARERRVVHVRVPAE